jgi:hypothetical protein
MAALAHPCATRHRHFRVQCPSVIAPYITKKPALGWLFNQIINLNLFFFDLGTINQFDISHWCLVAGTKAAFQDA